MRLHISYQDTTKCTIKKSYHGNSTDARNELRTNDSNLKSMKDLRLFPPRIKSLGNVPKSNQHGVILRPRSASPQVLPIQIMSSTCPSTATNSHSIGKENA